VPRRLQVPDSPEQRQMRRAHLVAHPTFDARIDPVMVGQVLVAALRRLDEIAIHRRTVV
jgi:hypothetical protein